MADNYKILAQTTAASIEPNSGLNQANIVYTVPENTQAAISSVSLINSSVTSEDYYLGVVKASDANNSVITTPDVVEMIPSFLATSFSNQYAYSTDGISWNLSDSSIPVTPFDIAYGAGKFVVISRFESLAAYSTDGITWSLTALPSSSAWVSIAYGNGKFVVIAGSSTQTSAAAHSTDGISWFSSTLSSSLVWQDITYGADRFVAVASNTDIIANSTDGISWSSTQVALTQQYSSIVYGNNVFVSLGASNFSSVSTNGIIWSIYGALPSSNYWRVGYFANKFIAFSQNTNTFAYSTNGITWTSSTLPMSLSWLALIPGTQNNKSVLLAQSSSQSAYSTDGITWTLTTMPLTTAWNGGAFGSVSYTTQGYSVQALQNSQTIIPTRSIEPNTVDEITGGITLSAGDQIRVYSESPDLIVQVYGVEIA